MYFLLRLDFRHHIPANTVVKDEIIDQCQSIMQIYR